MQNNNPLTEIGVIIIAALLTIIGGALLYVGKIDAQFALSLFILAVSLLGVNGALKAPSPGQQANMQQLVSDLTTTMGIWFQHTHATPEAAPAVATPAPQPAPPAPVVSQARAIAPGVLVPVEPQLPFPARSTFEMPVVPVQQ